MEKLTEKWNISTEDLNGNIYRCYTDMPQTGSSPGVHPQESEAVSCSHYGILCLPSASDGRESVGNA